MMLKKFFVVVLFVTSIYCAFATRVEAQTAPECYIAIQWCPLCGDPFIPGSTCYPEITILALCVLPSPNCAPPAAADETCPTCKAAQAAQNARPLASAPISLATGNTFIQQSDIRLPGLGGGLSLVRTWNSKWPSSQSSSKIGLFGPNWRSTYEERVFIGSDNYMKYSRSDGSFWSFGYLGPSWSLAAPGNVDGTMTETIGTTTQNPVWLITFQNGEQRVFDGTSGNLTSIIDPNGNTTTLSYDSTARLTTVTDPAGRHLYLGYGSSTSRLVTSVTSDFGVSLSYTYDTSGRLTQVTEPDTTTLSFAYDTNSLITSVTDSNNKTIESHTYDTSNRGLTGSRANGVDAVTITYPH